APRVAALVVRGDCVAIGEPTGEVREHTCVGWPAGHAQEQLVVAHNQAIIRGKLRPFAGVRLMQEPPSHRQSGNVASPTPSTGSEVTPEPSARITKSPPREKTM